MQPIQMLISHAGETYHDCLNHEERDITSKSKRNPVHTERESGSNIQ
jgi:hypothetical protein